MTTRGNKPKLSFKSLKPRKVQIQSEDLVSFRLLDAEKGLPLVMQANRRDINIDAWLKTHQALIQEKLGQHGALLFRGFDIPHEREFEAFAGQLCSELYGEYGDLPAKKGKIYGVTPYPPTHKILFHSESSHMHRWPSRQFFYCKVPAASGGETPIIDNRTIYQKLDPAIVQQFREKGLRYTRNFITGVDVSWQDFFKTDERDEVAAYCQANGIEHEWHENDHLTTHQYCPGVLAHPTTGEMLFFNQIQLHHTAFLEPAVLEALLGFVPKEHLPRQVTFGDGSPIPDAVALEIERVSWEHAAAFPWQHGDVLMVDNMLVAHARNPYQEPREMFVAMGDIVTRQALEEAALTTA